MNNEATKVINVNKAAEYKTALFAQIEAFCTKEGNMEALAQFIANENAKQARETANFEAAYARHHAALVEAGLRKLDSMIDDNHACEWV